MLVQIPRTTGTDAERALVDLLRTWKDPGSPRGVAVVNCGLSHDNRLHQFDAVVWTPSGCVVIETEKLVARQDGMLEVPLNGAWTIDGAPLATEGGERRTLLEKSREHTFALQSWLAARGLGQRNVFGVALILPPAGAHLRLQQTWSDPSFDVIIGDDPHKLRDYFYALAEEQRFLWTANDVAATFRSMNMLPFLPAPQDLLNEGFLGPIDVTLWHGGPSQAAAEAYVEERARAEQEEAQRPRFQAPWYSPWKLYPRESGDLDLGRVVMRTVLAIGMVIGVAWVLWFVITAFLTYGPS